jgi:chromate reductase
MGSRNRLRRDDRMLRRKAQYMRAGAHAPGHVRRAAATRHGSARARIGGHADNHGVDGHAAHAAQCSSAPDRRAARASSFAVAARRCTSSSGSVIAPVQGIHTMKPKSKVAVLVGSLRRGSFALMTAKAAVALAPPAFDCEFVGVGDLPLYNQDLEGEMLPAAWRRFRDAVRGADALLFVTPEYNRSVPGGLKNAIDVGSRPYGQSVWSGKPGAVISVSPGALAAFGANHHLRQSLVFLDVLPLQQPEAYIGGAASLFDADGALVNDATREFLTKFMAAFAAWIERVRRDVAPG